MPALPMGRHRCQYPGVARWCSRDDGEIAARESAVVGGARRLRWFAAHRVHFRTLCGVAARERWAPAVLEGAVCAAFRRLSRAARLRREARAAAALWLRRAG